ncbi:transglycosylase-like protein with SLT domain [Marinimicrobium koreense]|uniref:Transglycosylase-like protein with SLT domain n=1 Tax=Marinimicrobium koreense TaxID=306545 RepID=A0A3N1NXC7_9GAMM|nr:lytic transglycosylase domain-containing protein [Marinimicrobium koreense]ROQ20479.1 transglycosylase-like protein with SLT domain [Marinimicrobium koreense]
MRGPGVKKTAFSVLVALWMASAASFTWAQSNTLAYAEPAIEVDDQLRQKLLDNIRAADSFEDRFDAEAWLMLMSGRLERYVRDPDRRLRLLRKIHSAARQTDLQPELVLAVIEVESHFNHYAVSPVGAQGIMQVMPFWKNEIGRPEDNLIDLETNLRYGCTILKHYLERSEGRLAEALARYNGSYGSYRYAAKVMDAWERWR